MATNPVQHSSPLWPTATPPAEAQALTFESEVISFMDLIMLMPALMAQNLEPIKPVIEKIMRNWEKAQLRYPDKLTWSLSELSQATGFPEVVLQMILPQDFNSEEQSFSSADMNQAFSTFKQFDPD